MKIRFVDLLWSTGYIFKDPCPSWSGFMSSKVNDDKVFPKSYISRHRYYCVVFVVIILRRTM